LQKCSKMQHNELPWGACPGGAIGSCLATVIGESGFEAQAGRIIVSGYSGVCFIVISGAAV